MKKNNIKLIAISLLASAAFVPAIISAEPVKAVYENYDNIPKSLREALQRGDNYSDEYAVSGGRSTSTISTTSSGSNTLRTIEVQRYSDRATSNTIEVTQPTVSSETTYVDSTSTDSGYSEYEVKNSKKYGIHALSEQAQPGTAPTLPVRGIDVKRDKLYKQQEGKRYIIEDGAKYEVNSGTKLNIHNGDILPEGYHIENKSIKIPAFKLKDLQEKSSSLDDVKKKSSDYLKLSFQLLKDQIKGKLRANLQHLPKDKLEKLGRLL